MKAGRVVVAVQVLCWCAVSLLLLGRGTANLTAHTTYDSEPGRPARGFTAGVVMVTTASLMLVAAPTLLVFKLLDMRRQRRRQSVDGDLPPSYEEVTAGAPRYSTLFLTPDPAQVGLLGGLRPYGGSGPVVVSSAEAAPRYSTLHLATEPDGVAGEKATDGADGGLGEVARPDRVI